MVSSSRCACRTRARFTQAAGVVPTCSRKRRLNVRVLIAARFAITRNESPLRTFASSHSSNCTIDPSPSGTAGTMNWACPPARSGGITAARATCAGKPPSHSSPTTTTPDQMFARIKDSASASRPMTATTFGEDQEALYTNTGVHANHASTLLGATEENGQKLIEVRNPWGFSEGGTDGKDDGIFKLPLTDFMKLYQGADFGG